MVITKGLGSNESKRASPRMGFTGAKMKRKVPKWQGGRELTGFKAACYHDLIWREVVPSFERSANLDRIESGQKELTSCAFTNWMHDAAKTRDANWRMC